jgi:hypothetical protein
MFEIPQKTNVLPLARIFMLINMNSKNCVMSYLLIKQNDSKKFKSFLSGKEIEVGVVVSPTANIFGTGDEIEVFYGNESCDSYKAKITRQNKKSHPLSNGSQAMLMLGLVRR